MILFIMISTYETFSDIWKELVRSIQKGNIWEIMSITWGEFWSFLNTYPSYLFLLWPRKKAIAACFFFHPQTTVDPQKRPHFQTLALKVLLPTTSKPVKWEEEEWRINDEIKREKTVEPNADWQTLVLGSG